MRLKPRKYSNGWKVNIEAKGVHYWLCLAQPDLFPNVSLPQERIWVGWGNGGYRAQLLSMWMTKLSPSASEYDTFTYNAPGVYVKIQDE